MLEINCNNTPVMKHDIYISIGFLLKFILLSNFNSIKILLIINVIKPENIHSNIII